MDIFFVKSLVDKGYIQLNDDKSDGRRKFVRITNKAEKHYQQLSECLTKAIKLQVKNHYFCGFKIYKNSK